MAQEEKRDKTAPQGPSFATPPLVARSLGEFSGQHSVEGTGGLAYP